MELSLCPVRAPTPPKARGDVGQWLGSFSRASVTDAGCWWWNARAFPFGSCSAGDHRLGREKSCEVQQKAITVLLGASQSTSHFPTKCLQLLCVKAFVCQNTSPSIPGDWKWSSRAHHTGGRPGGCLGGTAPDQHSSAGRHLQLPWGPPATAKSCR